jgi:hypothetical protein
LLQEREKSKSSKTINILKTKLSRKNVVEDFSHADTAGLNVRTTIFLCGALSVNRARNIPAGIVIAKYREQ